MIFLSDYTELISNTFTIYYNDKKIIATKNKYGHYLNEKDVVYKFEYKKIQKDKVLNILLEQDNLPKELKDFVKVRTEQLVGKKIKMFTDRNDMGRFCENKQFAKYYGIDDPVETELEVVGVFDDKKEFDGSFDKNEKSSVAFGLWGIEEGVIDSSFIFSHPVQTKMCFGDFGTSELKKGSRFVKMVLKRP